MRPLSVEMEKCLISLSKNDSLIIELCKILRHRYSEEKCLTDDEIIENGMFLIIDGNIGILKTSLKRLDSEIKISILKEFSQAIVDLNSKIEKARN